jgi:hypothetical protein
MIELAEKQAKQGEKPLNVDDIFTKDTIESVMKKAQKEAELAELAELAAQELASKLK